MNTINLAPFYRSNIGFDRFGSLIDTALSNEKTFPGYPPYNIESIEENHYTVTLAVAGFKQSELDIQVEKGILTVSGKKAEEKNESIFLYKGIADRTFERKFNLADHIEVTDASLNNGLLTIDLVMEIPESMKPKRIQIKKNEMAVEHNPEGNKAA